MLITDVMQTIYRMYEGNNDTPDDTSDDYAVRLDYVNSGINLWDNQEGVLWNELYTTLTDTTDGTATIELPADFKFPSGDFVLSTGDHYTQENPANVTNLQQTNPSKHYYYITGGDGAKVLNLSVTPAADIGYSFPYYAKAHEYTDSSDEVEVQMSDPWFLIHWTLTQMYADDENTIKMAIHQPISTKKLSDMRIRNDMMAPNTSDTLSEINAFSFGR